MTDKESCASSYVVDVGGVDCGQNGVAAGVQDDVFGNGNYFEDSSRECIITYKRRKRNNLLSPKIELMQEEKPFTSWSSSCRDKMVKEQGGKVDSLTQVNDAENEHQLKSPRDIVLEQMCKSISETGGSLHRCLKDILSHTGSSCRTAVKGGDNKCQPHTVQTINWMHNGGQVLIDAEHNRLPSESEYKITKLCQRKLVDILMSEKFAQLCSLLMEFLSVTRVNEFLDITKINSRMENGTYEMSPVLFDSDIEQLLTKVLKFGTHLISFGRCYLDKFSSAPHEHVASSVPKVGKHEFGEHEDVKDFLVCDFCEEIYYPSCIEAAAKEISNGSWYCSKCTTAGVQLAPHNNCVVCERQNAADNSTSNLFLKDRKDKSEENSNNSDVDLDSEENLHCCSICGTKVEDNQDHKVCGHAYCPNKYYHARCLTGKQLSTHGPCWYCPSCLCVACLIDKDDDKIVLCDCCDHAYHIYCAEPPLNAIPKGKWFCEECETGVQQMQAASKKDV